MDMCFILAEQYNFHLIGMIKNRNNPLGVNFNDRDFRCLSGKFLLALTFRKYLFLRQSGGCIGVREDNGKSCHRGSEYGTVEERAPLTGAMWIPHDEMAKRYDEIPEECPVILHCGAGVVSVSARLPPY